MPFQVAEQGSEPPAVAGGPTVDFNTSYTEELGPPATAGGSDMREKSERGLSPHGSHILNGFRVHESAERTAA